MQRAWSVSGLALQQGYFFRCGFSSFPCAWYAPIGYLRLRDASQSRQPHSSDLSVNAPGVLAECTMQMFAGKHRMEQNDEEDVCREFNKPLLYLSISMWLVTVVHALRVEVQNPEVE